MHIGSALLVGIASFMSRHCSSVCPSICLSVNFSCPLHISFINRQVLFIQCLNGSPYRDNVKNSYISPAQCAPRSQFEVKVQLMTFLVPGRVAQSVGHLTRKSGVLGSISVWQHTFVSPSAFTWRAIVSYWRKYVHEELVNLLGGLSLPRKSVVRLTDRPDMTLDVYRGRKTTMQQQQRHFLSFYKFQTIYYFFMKLCN